MEQGEIETLVGDLETRIDRLRALYDQYFMGIEKLEPNVPRKDIDRRIFILRKVQIRNTGIRFRFQMILQRYNTYQTYWQRICRKIDDGTYKRHMLRAEARFGDGVGGAQRKSRAPSVAPPSNSAPAADDNAWLDQDFPEPALPRIAPPPVAGAPLPAASATFPVTPNTSKWRKAIPAEPRASSPPPPVAAPRATATAAPNAPPPLPTRQAPPLPAAANASRPPPTPGAASLKPAPGAPSLPPARPLPPPAPSRFTKPPVPTTAPAPVAAPAKVAPAPPPPAKVAPAAPPPPPPRPAAPAASELPDDRVRQIYAQYVDTKRKQNESTAAITYDGLAKSLRESSAKLREKHGRAIDFEVAVKDGKTILKPVVK